MIRDAADKALKEGKPLLDTVVEEAIKSFVGTLPLAFTDILSRMRGILNNANELISTTNKIIDELSKEGMHLPKIEQIESKDDIMSLSIALKNAKQKLQTIISFLKEIEKYGKQ